MNTFSRLATLSLLTASTTLVASCAGWPLRPGAPKVDLNVATPDSFLVRFETSRGRIDVMARKDWAPIGVDRFYALVQSHYYDDARFFRVPKNFVAQFGIAADPAISAAWRSRTIGDDQLRRGLPVHSNTHGTISFARGGVATRTTQLFINMRDNARLDTLNGFGFPPIAEIVSGLAAADSIYSGYGEATSERCAPPKCAGPRQDSVVARGNAYLSAWPKLDYIKTARIVREWRGR